MSVVRPQWSSPQLINNRSKQQQRQRASIDDKENTPLQQQGKPITPLSARPNVSNPASLSSPVKVSPRQPFAPRSLNVTINNNNVQQTSTTISPASKEKNTNINKAASVDKQILKRISPSQQKIVTPTRQQQPPHKENTKPKSSSLTAITSLSSSAPQQRAARVVGCGRPFAARQLVRPLHAPRNQSRPFYKTQQSTTPRSSETSSLSAALSPQQQLILSLKKQLESERKSNARLLSRLNELQESLDEERALNQSRSFALSMAVYCKDDLEAEVQRYWHPAAPWNYYSAQNSGSSSEDSHSDKEDLEEQEDEEDEIEEQNDADEDKDEENQSDAHEDNDEDNDDDDDDDDEDDDDDDDERTHTDESVYADDESEEEKRSTVSPTESQSASPVMQSADQVQEISAAFNKFLFEEQQSQNDKMVGHNEVSDKDLLRFVEERVEMIREWASEPANNNKTNEVDAGPDAENDEDEADADGEEEQEDEDDDEEEEADDEDEHTGKETENDDHANPHDDSDKNDRVFSSHGFRDQFPYEHNVYLLSRHFHILHRLYSCPDAVTFKAIHRATQMVVVIKISEGYHTTHDAPHPKEIRLISSAQGHRNIMSLLGWYGFTETRCYAFITQYVENTGIDVLFNKRDDIREYMKQMLLGIQHLHARNILYRDVKPSNVLWNPRTKTVTIIDFDVATYYNSSGLHRSCVGTEGYMAPEVLSIPHHRDTNINGYTQAVDVYSAGMVFGQLLFGYYEDEIADKLRHDCKGQAWIQKILSYATQQEYRILAEYHLLLRMLTADPKLRITIPEALQHPYFNNAYTNNNSSIIQQQ